MGASGSWEAGQWLDICQAEAAQIGKLQCALAGDIAERVAPFGIAIRERIRHGADADAVEYDPDHTAKSHAYILALSGALASGGFVVDSEPDDSATHRDRYSFRAVLRSELFEDVPQVHFDGVLGNAQLLCNIAIPIPPSDPG